MIRFFLFFGALFFFTSVDAQVSIKENSKVNESKIDSFEYHYKILTRIAKKNPYDTSFICRNAVRYLEKVTGKKAHSDGDYFGWKYFSKKDLEEWRRWKNNNR